jgi:LAO/AO transport system kinase
LATEDAEAGPVAGILAGDTRAIARAMSAMADGHAAELAAALRAHTGRALVVGVTGPPGVGKSTLVDRLITAYRAADRTVGVVAVDPSSPFSGGAILGDRVRMQAHAMDSGVFIRSLATRGASGGLARGAAGAVCVLDAAGFDVILVETVGVGQDEIDIASLADVRIVVLVPEAGDDVQSLKAGLMEIADIFVINKSDRPGAEHTAASIERALSLDAPADDGWVAPVVRAVATEGVSVGEIVAAVDRFCRDAGARRGRRRAERLARPIAAGAAGGARLDHVGIAAANPAAVLAFLAQTFGRAAEPPIEAPAHGVRVRFVRFPNGAFEVLEPLDPSSRVSDFLARRGPGLHHVAVAVPDLDDVVRALKARGVRLVDDVPRPGAEGRRVAFVHPAAAGGVLVELIEERAERAIR